MGHGRSDVLEKISRAEEPECINESHSRSGPSARAGFLGELKQIPRRTTISTLHILSVEEKMSQQDIQSTGDRSISTRSVVLVILLVGLGAGAVGYGLNNAFAASNPSQQNTTNNYGQWSGWRGPGPPGWDKDGVSTLSFRAASTVANVTATGFAITDSTHFTITIAFHGTGSTPAITVVGLAPGLSGSTTVASGWTSPTTVTVTLTGTGSTTTTMSVRALIVPLTS
jgi:hypothetical protein